MSAWSNYQNLPHIGNYNVYVIENNVILCKKHYFLWVYSTRYQLIEIFFGVLFEVITT
jgi:hypothetical protein